MNWQQKKILEYMMLGQQSFDYIYSLEDSIELIFYYGNARKIRVPQEYKKVLIKEITPSCYMTNEKIIEVKILEGIEAIY